MTMLAQEFQFFRNVRTYYCHVTFDVEFTYRYAHRLTNQGKAHGSFRCGVNAYTQMVEYTMKLQSDPIERPCSEKNTFLFNHIYPRIPKQCITFDEYPVFKQKYRVPIDYDWQQFVEKGAETAINVNTMNALLRKWRFLGDEETMVDAGIKVTAVRLNWT
ncbi:hypothetical protein [Paenibacillus chungangensis]|uniref:Uncharacterized protein n=1 Tax=Paenibacillus chungangensis TaxID=696535 RepID=A0ABW3HXM9_9BACL